jgi:hypothetical protein
MGAWYIRVTGKRREGVDVNLIVQAVIALGEQLRRETAAQQPNEPRVSKKPEPQTEVSS